MGTTKKELFSKSDNQLAALAKALGHPARIAILRELGRINGCVCGDLVEELPLSQSTVSQHLKELKKVGLIVGEVEGKKICYCINKKAWQQAQVLIAGFFGRCC